MPTHASPWGQGGARGSSVIGAVQGSLQPEQGSDGVSKAKAEGGENSLWLLQGESVPQTTPHHLSTEQTLSQFWSADLEHLRGVLLEHALEYILPFHSIMQVCCAEAFWILSQNGHSGMKKTQWFQKESYPGLWLYAQPMLPWLGNSEFLQGEGYFETFWTFLSQKKV